MIKYGKYNSTEEGVFYIIFNIKINKSLDLSVCVLSFIVFYIILSIEMYFYLTFKI